MSSALFAGLLGIGILALVFSIVFGKFDNNVIVTPSVSPTVTVVDKRILFDTFTQAGVGSIPLSAHTPEIGGPWSAWTFTVQPELELILGEGYCTNTMMTVDLNQACVCNYDNAHETLDFTINFYIPSTITPAGDLAGMAVAFATSAANGYSIQFFYDPNSNSYGLQMVQITGGGTDLILASQFLNTPPPLDQTIILNGSLKPTGGLSVSVLDAAIFGQGSYSPIVNNLNQFVCGLFRGNPVEIINIRMQEVLIKAV
jgi:hypothetical protein